MPSCVGIAKSLFLCLRWIYSIFNIYILYHNYQCLSSPHILGIDLWWTLWYNILGMERKEIEEIRKLNPYGRAITKTQPKYPQNNAHNSILPLTDWDQWYMACILDVPLEIVKQVEGEFWKYIEDPSKKKKYRTSYLTIKNWIRMKLSKGEIQNCSDTDRLRLATQDPDTMKLIQETFEFQKRNK